MNDVIHFVMLIVAVSMIGIGLWLIAPAAMWVGVGGLILAGVVAARMFGGRVRKGAGEWTRE